MNKNGKLKILAGGILWLGFVIWSVFFIPSCNITCQSNLCTYNVNYTRINGKEETKKIQFAKDSIRTCTCGSREVRPSRRKGYHYYFPVIEFKNNTSYRLNAFEEDTTVAVDDICYALKNNDNFEIEGKGLKKLVHEFWYVFAVIILLLICFGVYKNKD